MSITILQGDALALPLPDNSVDLVVTSPPYFGLRSYQDGGEHYAGQIGAEPTPAEFVDALIAATAEMVRVVKPSGSIWVNLGDKYAGGGGQWDKDERPDPGRRRAVSGKVATGGKSWGHRPKTLIGIPWRYAIRCIDDLGLILRAEVIWSKPNGLPESVTDRVRRSHEQWFHFTLNPRYYSAVDEVREPYTAAPFRGQKRHAAGDSGATRNPVLASLTAWDASDYQGNPLGKLPGSVWTIPTEPLQVPDHLGIDHFAAFPTEWPRRIIQGWSPREVCGACGEGRRPVIASVGLDMGRPQARRAQELADRAGLTEEHFGALLSVGVSDTGRGAATQSGTGKNTAEVYRLAGEAREALGGYAREYLLRRPTSLGEACACPSQTVRRTIEEFNVEGDRVTVTVDVPDPTWVNPAPTTPGVVLDPFGGTGTTALVADALGRHGITLDMSRDYCRLAEWRTTDPKQRAKAARRDYTPPAEQVDGQLGLFEGIA